MTKEGAAAQAQGHCEAAFAQVRQAFSDNFDCYGEEGAALAIYVAGKPVVDLWGGFRDRDRSQPWQRDTLVNMFSAGKPLVAVCIQRLVEHGLLALDRPVADYWPAFAAQGKDAVRVEHLLNHRAGLPALSGEVEPEAIYDWSRMVALLEQQAPWWEPGTAQGYHAFTFGWLLGELAQRVSGLDFAALFQREVAELLELDFHFGLSPSQLLRVADVGPIDRSAAQQYPVDLPALIGKDPAGLTALTFCNPSSLLTGSNRSAWRRAVIPAANGHGSAAALARFYAALSLGGTLDGVALLSPEAVRRCYTESSFDTDRVFNVPLRFSQGFILGGNPPYVDLGLGANSFGHSGAGGTLGFADPDAGIGFAYVTHRLSGSPFIDRRAQCLIDALYRCL